MLSVFQIAIVTCFMMDKLTRFDNSGSEVVEVPNHFYSFMVKLPLTLALHLILAPFASQGMLIMKYAVNNYRQFAQKGAQTAFLIGLAQYLVSVYCEIATTIVMVFASEVYQEIVIVLIIAVAIKLPDMYFQSFSNNELKKVCDEELKVVVRGRFLPFSSRSSLNKVARMVYRVLRTLYVSLIYYFIPFAVLSLTFFMARIFVLA